MFEFLGYAYYERYATQLSEHKVLFLRLTVECQIPPINKCNFFFLIHSTFWTQGPFLWFTAESQIPPINKRKFFFFNFWIFLDHLPQCCNQTSFTDFNTTSVHPMTWNQTLSNIMWYVDMYTHVYVCEYCVSSIRVFSPIMENSWLN